MNTSEKTTGMRYESTAFSIMDRSHVQYIYADILSLYMPGAIDECGRTHRRRHSSSPRVSVGSRDLDGDPIAMVFLSLVLKHRVNRWANIIVGVHLHCCQYRELVGRDLRFTICSIASIEIALHAADRLVCLEVAQP